MDESILLSIKKVLALDPDNRDFDTDIILHINSVLAILQQLGIGSDDGFAIEDEYTTWQDYLGSDAKHIALVKSYMAAKVRLLFDVPVSSSVMESLSRSCSEFEWRLNVAAENYQLEKEAADT